MARILVIEDNWANLEVMTYLLGAYGHEVLSARDGADGLEQARAARPELIVCDIHMPRMDGYEVAREVKSIDALRGVPLIAVTALAMVGDREKVLQGGFAGYIPKPIVPETFVAQLESHLGMAPRAAVQAPSTSARSENQPRAPVAGAILVVDDVAINREVIRQTLEPLGYGITTASTVDEALQHARRSPPELIICDLHLRGEHGYDLLKAIKADARLSEIPFMFISASVMGEKDHREALMLGADQFIVRPVEPEALQEKVRASLERAARGAEKD